jgi:MFS family permease
MYSRVMLKALKEKKMNLVVKILIISDVIIWSSCALLTPIFAIFITDKIGGNIEVVGITTALYFISKAALEVLVGMFVDRTQSEKDDLYLAFAGTTFMAVLYFSYIFINSVAQLYLVQILLGIGAAFAFPGWYSMFTRHIDKGKEAFEWSFYDVLLGIGMAAASAAGGFIVYYLGFNFLFVLVSILMLLGSFLLLSLRKRIWRR